MKFGVHTGLQNTTIDELGALWQRIEGHGFEWISIWDHFYAATRRSREGVKSGYVPRGDHGAHARSR